VRSSSLTTAQSGRHAEEEDREHVEELEGAILVELVSARSCLQVPLEGLRDGDRECLGEGIGDGLERSVEAAVCAEEGAEVEVVEREENGAVGC
jgi:hypothetical protein